MAATIHFKGGSSAQRVVRSQRMWKGILVGAIRDQGWLVMVRCYDLDGQDWRPVRAIRKREVNA